VRHPHSHPQPRRLAGLIATGVAAGVLAGCAASHPASSGDAHSRAAARTDAAAAEIGGHGRLGALTVTGAYVPVPASPDVAAAYFTVHNHASSTDTLTAISSPLTSNAHLHHYIRSGGAERMAPLARLTIPAHGAGVLRPGGNHVMLMHPNRPLRQGDSITLRLHFTRAGNLTITVPVVSAAGPAAGSGGTPMPNMSAMPMHGTSGASGGMPTSAMPGMGG
jgi:copper(I)-binding protein